MSHAPEINILVYENEMFSKQSVVLKCKKSFFWRKLTKISNLIFCFSEILKVFVCFHVRQVAFLYEDWKKLSVWRSVLFTVFSMALYMCEGTHIENRRDQTCLSLSTGSPFRARPIQAGFTVHCLTIICKYLRLNDRPDYQRSGLNTY